METQGSISSRKTAGDCYRLLAACFYQPQKDAFLQEGLFRDLASLLKTISPDALPFVEEMENAFIKYSEEELMVDHAKLFVGPNELLAPPYGSVYLDKERRVMGDSTMEAVKLYNEAGLSMDDNFRELPDHIAAELEFMYYLIYKETEAVESSDHEKADYFMEAQGRFYQNFLSKWVKPFCDKITEGTDNKFYKALAGCLSTFIYKST